VKILVLDCNVRYISPNRNTLSVLFSCLGDVEFFGPGYVSCEVLREGLEKFKQVNGPFDVTILTEHSSGPFLDENSIKLEYDFLRRAFSFDFTLFDYKCFRASLKDALSDGSLIVQTLTQMDPWADQSARLRWCEEYSDLIWTLGSQFLQKKLNNLSLNHNHNQLNNYNNYVSFVERNSHKILPYLHYIHESELNFNLSFRGRKDIAVPGTLYSDRLNVYFELKRLGFSISDNRNVVYKALRFFGSFFDFNILASSLFFDWYNQTYLKSISEAKIAYTSGTDFDIFVRKFIEIPSRSTVMICRSPAGMAFTGFREGVDYIHLETLNELEGINRYLEDEDGLERMAISARNIVLRYHTLHARVAQLNEAINKSSGNAFNGAEWHSGDILFL
jgi:hypothetical protein